VGTTSNERHSWRLIVPTQCKLRELCISEAVANSRILRNTTECLNSLQTPFAVLEEKRRLGMKLDASAVDKMKELVRRTGHEACFQRIYIVMIRRPISLRYRNSIFSMLFTLPAPRAKALLVRSLALYSWPISLHTEHLAKSAVIYRLIVSQSVKG